MSDKETEETEAEPPKKGGKRKLMLLIGLPVLMALIGGAAGAYFLGLVPGANAAVEPGEEVVEEVEDISDIVFVELPDLLVNLNATGRRMHFLKITTALEVEGEEQAETVRQFVPRILDSFHMYLRSIRPEELQGAEGVYRIKEELLARTNDAVRPAEVRDVLVRELLVQ